MELGIIGLGRMGGNIAKRMLLAGHRIVGYDQQPTNLGQISPLGGEGAASVLDLVNQLESPRAVWVMLPSGEVTETTICTLSDLLSPDDTLIDGGNSNYKDSIRRAKTLGEKGIKFLDVGTSGGIWGLDNGYSMMIGGDLDAFQKLEPIFQSLAPAPNQGYGHVGNAGAGHFVKMVHNGIEYGLMQAYSEGFELMEAKTDFDLNLNQVATIWQHGSVVQSWLLELTAKALEEDPGLESILGYVEDSGEGRWTVHESIELDVPLPVISLALQTRFRSRQDQPFGARLLAALRNQFGGHATRKS